MLSEVGISPKNRRLIWSAVLPSCIVGGIAATISSVFPVAISIIALVLGLTHLILGMKASINVVEDDLILRCRPFYSTKIRLSDVQLAAKGIETTLIHGFGIRMFGVNVRGILVGGPTLSLQTATKEWLISTNDPDTVIDTINLLIAEHKKQ